MNIEDNQLIKHIQKNYISKRKLQDRLAELKNTNYTMTEFEFKKNMEIHIIEKWLKEE